MVRMCFHVRRGCVTLHDWTLRTRDIDVTRPVASMLGQPAVISQTFSRSFADMGSSQCRPPLARRRSETQSSYFRGSKLRGT